MRFQSRSTHPLGCSPKWPVTHKIQASWEERASPGLDFPVQAPPSLVTERWKGERQSFKWGWVWLMLGSRFRIT